MLKLLTWINTIFLILILSTPAKSDNIELAPIPPTDFYRHLVWNSEYPPGSFKIEYGGIRGLIVDQLDSRLKDIWRDTIRIRFRTNPIEESRRIMYMHDHILDNTMNGRWWNRNWWHSLPEKKGGAPEIPIIKKIGPQENFIDLGIFYLSSKMKFKFREYDWRLSGNTNRGSWNFKFRPEVRFSTSSLVNRAFLSFIFYYSKNSGRIFSLKISAGWTRTHGSIAFFEINFLQW